MVNEGHQGGEEFQDDCGVDKVDTFPYRVGDPIGARGPGGGGFGAGESDLIFA